MIKGLYEAHLPVSNLEKAIAFYENLGLTLAWRSEKTVFLWVEKDKSWLGLWEGKEVQTPYHPSLRHIAFRIDYEDMKNATSWLKSIGATPRPFADGMSAEPFVRPYQGHACVYFDDPDGNSLELMSFIEVPEQLKTIEKKLLLEEWEALLNGVSTTMKDARK
ncbi:extradiol dioxygenase [Lottiidibacillus patelloidae]|uniref:Extradiol dioxygenase n=1 Tax=Lottiidibacillus patelloidae TaxID=2670334 RepID=A0A263BT17_9BACI|nr:VOC family protein [Lottiidibacillus patelloidae]OZM56839.1 extradiol dioxygenase [Lottiidibacillus patelloidae]